MRLAGWAPESEGEIQVVSFYGKGVPMIRMEAVVRFTYVFPELPAERLLVMEQAA